MRYGRPLNHMKVQHAEVKFFLHCDQQLSDANELYKTANKAMAESADTTGEGQEHMKSIRSRYTCGNTTDITFSCITDTWLK